MAVIVSGSGTTTLTLNVTGSAATNYANTLPNTYPAIYTFPSVYSNSIGGALNIVLPTGSTPDYVGLGYYQGEVAIVSSGEPFTIAGSREGHDTIFGGADITYMEDNYLGNTNLVVFTQGTNSFDGSSEYGGDTIVGGSGYDTIYTSTGSSTVFSGTGHTLAYLDDGEYGFQPNESDLAVMQSGTMTVYANGISDTIAATATGQVFGGTGTLTFVDPGTSNTVPITVVGGTGTADMFGGNSLDLTLSGSGTQIFIAGQGNETLNGSGSAGFSFFGSTDPGATTTIIGGNGDFFSTGAGTETYTAGTNDIFNITSVAAANHITISDFNASDTVNFASPTVSSTTTNGTDYTVTLTNGATVEFVGISSLLTHTT